MLDSITKYLKSFAIPLLWATLIIWGLFMMAWGLAGIVAAFRVLL